MLQQSGRRFLQIVTLLISAFLVCSCGLFNSTDNTESTSPTNKLEKIEIAPLVQSITKGIQLQLSATAFYDNQTKENISNAAQWNTSDRSISTISDSGVLTALSSGPQTISVSYLGTTAEINIHIKDVSLESIVINPANPVIAKSTNIALTASGTFSDGSISDVTDQISWSIEKTDLISQTNPGKFQADEIGTSKITATIDDISNSTTVEIKAGTLTSIEIDTNNAALLNNENIQLNAIGIFEEGYKQDLSQAVSWLVSDDTLFSIDANSLVGTALNTGNVEITAQLGDISQTKSLIVEAPSISLESIAIINNDTPQTINENRQLILLGSFSDGSQIDVTQSASWFSDDPTVLRVSNSLGHEGNTLALSAGTATITAEFADQTTSLLTHVSAATLVRIDITLQRQTLAIDTSLPLVATGIFDDNSTRDLTNLVSWASTDETVIHVSNDIHSKGLISALNTGTTNITATFEGITDSAEVAVNDASLVSINIEHDASALHTGLVSEFTAIGIFSDGRKQDISHLVVWASSNPDILYISNSFTNPGGFSALATGSSVITASLNNITGFSQQTTTASSIESIVIHSPQTSISQGTSLALNATAYYSDKTSINITQLGNWLSSNNQILEFSQIDGNEGLASANDSGEVTVSVEYLGKTAELGLTINEANLTGINITPQNLSLATDTHIRLTATGVYDNNQTQDLTQQVLWSSDNAAKVFISNATGKTGFAYALNAGTANVSASLRNITGNVVINVTEVTLEGITVLFDGESTIANGSHKTLSAFGNFSDGSTQDLSRQVTWQSADATICSIRTAGNRNGKLLAKSNGNCTITARFENVSATILFSITDASLTSIAISPSEITLPNGTQTQLSATGTYSDGSTQDLTNQVTWQASNLNSQINENGILKAATVGSTIINASFGTLEDSLTVTISSANLESISISTDKLTINQGLDQQFSATGTYSDGAKLDITKNVLWESSDNAVASIHNNDESAGLLSALTEGSSTISATIGSVTISTTISVELDPSAAKSLSMSATPYVIYNDNTDTSEITINVLAVDSTLLIADGTVINLDIINGSATLDVNTVATSQGSATFSLKSDFKGVITVKATIADTTIGNFITVYSTNDFAEIIAKGIVLSANVVDNVVQTNSTFGLALVNYANRPFNILEFKIGTEGNVIFSTTSADLLNNNLFAPGDLVYLGWITEQERPNSFIAVYWLSEPKTGLTFPVGIIYNLPENL